jgi:GNAT superfamily N-acetyltransferase
MSDSCFEVAPCADGSAMGMQAITLRRIEASDSLEELTAMLHRAFSRQRQMGLNCTCVDQSVQVTRERIEKGACYIAACGGRLVGTVTLYAPDCQSQSHWYHQPDVASVHQLAVAPDFQNSGLGTALLQFAEDWATERGYTELALDTAQPAIHLLSFYMRHGYRFVESVRFQGKVYYSVILSKELLESANRLLETHSAPAPGHYNAQTCHTERVLQPAQTMA